MPFRQFVLKVHSRCDLACDHCYVYEHADQSWRGRPAQISGETATLVARRIAEHAAAHKLPEVRVVLHGGEPLLLGPRRTRDVLNILRDTVQSDETRLDLRIHTNAVLLDRDFLDLFAEYGVQVGVSLDGDRAANDRHRLYRDGRSSYDKVAKALSLLRSAPYRHLYAGLLCTIDIANDPDAVYRGLLEHEPTRIDFLLPHATWANQPAGLHAPRDLRDPRRTATGERPEYAAWLGRVYDLWNAAGRPVPVRTFDSVIAALHGRPSQTESLGLVPADLVVVETDGTLEQVDSLKTAYEGAAATGFDVRRNSFDEAATHTGITARQHGVADLCAVCRQCPLVSVCGGGLYAHRFAEGTGFQNPSVYCADLSDTINHIRDGELVGQDRRGRTDRITAAEQEQDTHALRAADIDALAAGFGDGATIHKLADAQRSIVRNLLVKIARSGPQYDDTFTAAWDRFAELDESEPDAVDRVLAHPYVRAWAVECIEALGRGAIADLGYLDALNASVTFHAKLGGRFTLTVDDGCVALPSLGSLYVGDDSRQCVVDIDPSGTAQFFNGEAGYRVKLRAADADAGDETPWRPVRPLLAAGLAVGLEDTDPYRRCHEFAAPRLDAEEASRWQSAFPAAIGFVDEYLPRYAPGLRAGLTAIMPMLAPSDGTDRSAAARHAFGAVGVALPADPTLLALLLIHEFQHVKLGAVLDLYTLFDPADTAARHYAPWRPDPRPLEGLLQGTYAHIAVTDFWRVRRTTAAGVEARKAETHFARWRAHTAEAVRQLLASGSLTALGERFARAMGETVAPWLDESVGAEALAAARASSERHRASFEAALRASRR
ncbi:MAG: FxsB family cyclophane-forming radical SAM/SPASM peptide maturase, partial [Actinocrinis sp.]